MVCDLVFILFKLIVNGLIGHHGEGAQNRVALDKEKQQDK